MHADRINPTTKDTALMAELGISIAVPTSGTDEDFSTAVAKEACS